MQTRSLRAALAIVLLAPLLSFATATVASAASTYYVASNGSGSSCSSSKPCRTFEAALGVARPGDTVRVRAGSYPLQEIDRGVSWDSGDSNITFRPESGTVRVDGIRSHVPSLTFRGFRITGVMYMHPGANGNVARDNVIDLAFVTGADDTTWIGNTLKPDRDGPDAMQVKGLNGDNPRGVTIIGNTFGPQWRSGDSHTDCLQILGGDDIVIERNIFYPCADKALQIRSGAGGTVGDVRIEGNYISECAPRRDQCNGYHAAVIAAEGNRIELIHNSINGSIAFSESGSSSGGSNNVTLYGNIAASLPCTPHSDWNMVESKPCGSHDIVGRPTWVNDSELVQDLHLVDGSKGIGTGSPHVPDIDIDNQTDCAGGDLGADQTCGERRTASGDNAPAPPAPPSSELISAVSWMHRESITTEGPSVAAFRANEATTRGQAVTFLHRAERRPSGSGSLLPDVDGGRFYADAVRWAADTGVVTGYPDGWFRPDGAVTRGEFAVILFRAAGSPSTPPASIVDVGNGSFYAEAVAWAKDVGVMNGYGDGRFGPDDWITRGQIALMMCRFSDRESLAVGACT